MLRELGIRNFVLIEALDLVFKPGLNVLTGETGAGKSILLDALGFALGGRGRGSHLRSGAQNGEVSAEFDVPPGHAVLGLLSEAGLPGDETLILRRLIDRDGRSRAFVNDRRCSADLLRNVGESLLEVHGQHDDRGLLDPREHRGLLDAFAGCDALLSNVDAAWTSMSRAEAALEAAKEAREAAARDEEFLRHAVKELTDFAAASGEDANLDTERRLLQAGERIREEISRAALALGPSGSEGQINDARRWLEDVADDAAGQLDDPLAALERALTELGEAQDGVELLLGSLDRDPARLEAVEERLFALRALARKHRVPPDQLPGLAEELDGRLKAIDGGAAHVQELAALVEETHAAYASAAASLSAVRKKASSRLDAALATELPGLKMDRARFETSIEDAPAGPSGTDRVTFQVAPNPGAAAGPLNRIASGGELSRFLLALKVCLASQNSATTMIFDEIDRGVGGATADAVGRRLAMLAETAQVLVVTHSPQVAARGDHHWQIAKRVENNETRTLVTPIADAAREDELARMLSGERLTDEARAAARALLAG